jgi:Low affinity iron permease
VINAGTTIVTFLMLFLIRRTQNRDALAIHPKLNEIVKEPDDFVFSRSDGSPWDPDFLRKEVLYRALDAAGIAPGAKVRHSAGSIIHAVTGDLKLAQPERRTQ